MPMTDSEFGRLRDEQGEHAMQIAELSKQVDEVRMQINEMRTNGDVRWGRMEKAVAANTEITAQALSASLRNQEEIRAVSAGTKEIIDLVGQSKTGLRLAGWFGRAMAWVLGLGAAGATIYAALRHP